jgi:tetratricopeptide (TPR) repeat protein
VLLVRLGNLCESAGRLEEAAGHYHAALARGRVRSSAVHVRRGDENLTLRLGQLYTRLGQRHRAERLWSEFLKRHPDAPAVRKALATSYLNPCSIIVGPAQ